MIREQQSRCAGLVLKTTLLIAEAVEWEAKEMLILELSLEKNTDEVIPS